LIKRGRAKTAVEAEKIVKGLSKPVCAETVRRGQNRQLSGEEEKEVARLDADSPPKTPEMGHRAPALDG